MKKMKRRKNKHTKKLRNNDRIITKINDEKKKKLSTIIGLILPRGYEIVGPETSFHRIVVLPKRHVIECQLVESSYCRIVKLAKLYNVECHFIKSVFSRTLFFRHII